LFDIQITNLKQILYFFICKVYEPYQVTLFNVEFSLASLMKYQCLISLHILITPKLCQDYWSEDFDTSKNCKDEELIGKLILEYNPQRCASKWKGIILR
jgi:hypothetical protein